MACVGYLDPFIPSLVRAPASAAIIALTMVWLLTAVNIWGLQAAANDSFAPRQGPADYAQKSAAALVLRPAEFLWNGQDVAALKPFLA